MRKLIAIYRRVCNGTDLRIYETPNKFKGEVKTLLGEFVSGADFEGKDKDIYRVKEYFNFTNSNSYEVPFERKNGKIVLYPINKQRRIIWTNEDCDEWCNAMREEITDEEITPEYYYTCRNEEIYDERINLHKDVDGYIVAFAELGLWNGNTNGAKIVGTIVSDILYSDCDYVTWYCDPYNVRCSAAHHDGRNYILYRVADSKEQAERLVNKIAYEGMTEEQFRRATKSLRPYVAKVYGW
jgi:hypothetical protein